MVTKIEVIEERESGVLVLIPVNRLDGANADSFESLVMDHIDNGEHDLIIDFSRLKFVSSAGMRVILVAAKQLQTKRGKFILCAMKDNIHDVFRVSGFDKVMLIRNSRWSALASL